MTLFEEGPKWRINLFICFRWQIQKFAPRFMGYNQQDAQEFLRYLLEGLHEDVNRVAVKPKPLEHDIADSLRYPRCSFFFYSTNLILLNNQLNINCTKTTHAVTQIEPSSRGSVTCAETIRRLWTFLLDSSSRLCSAPSAVTAALRSIPFGICPCPSRPLPARARLISDCSTVSIYLPRRKFSTETRNRYGTNSFILLLI